MVAEMEIVELDFDDTWSEDELAIGPQPGSSRHAPVPTSEETRVKQLELELENARAEAASLRNLLRSTLEDGERVDTWVEVSGPGMSHDKGKGKEKARAVRDDDTHYFDSYAENGQSSCAVHQQVLPSSTVTTGY